MTRWMAILVVAGVASPLPGQVGHLPERSPYRDLTYTQEWTVFGGYFRARKDPEGAAPRGGPMYGGRYDWRIGGPAYLTARFASASLERQVIDPKKAIGQRFVGTQTLPLLFADFGLAINLTGFKTWHGFAPQVNGGAGLTADLAGRSDLAKFRFGEPFTLTYGAALKWVGGGKWQLRGDWSSYMYQIHYPDSYYLRTSSEDPVRLPNEPRSLWRRNTAFQLGLSYLFHR